MLFKTSCKFMISPLGIAPPPPQSAGPTTGPGTGVETPHNMFRWQSRSASSVSYTHLDVYKRQEEALRGVGTMDYKPIDTPVVEIAADGQTAKGIWCIRGSHSKILPSGPVAYWEWGWFAADFILEDGAFRIWHLQYLQEILRPNGHPWYGSENVYPALPEFAPAADFHFPVPDHPAVLRAKYTADRPFTKTPRVPEPYDTFADTFSYGWKEEA